MSANVIRSTSARTPRSTTVKKKDVGVFCVQLLQLFYNPKLQGLAHDLSCSKHQGVPGAHLRPGEPFSGPWTVVLRFCNLRKLFFLGLRYFVSAKGEIRPHQADMMLLPSLFTLATVRSPMSLLPVWTHI